MEWEFRELYGAEDLEKLLQLQGEVGGLPPRDTMSPITLSALTLKEPRVGWLLGAFDRENMTAFSIALCTAVPGQVFGHMLGVLPEYRDTGLGSQMIHFAHSLYKQSGMHRICWTYEPLESRNAHIYIHNLGARCVRYLRDHYHLESGLHHGMPQDRILIELDLNAEPKANQKAVCLDEVVARYPAAGAHSMPSAELVLVEIPGNLRELQDREPAAALTWRMDTRLIFEEYINKRGMTADRFYTGLQDGRRRSFYLLCKTQREAP